jgi:hypothetical protein
MIVTTQGRSRKWVTEWLLDLRPTSEKRDSVWLSHWRYAERKVAFPLSGEMSFRRGGIPGASNQMDSLPVDLSGHTDTVRMRWPPEASSIVLEGAPFETNDAGTIYSIYVISEDGRLFGRWSDGGFPMRIIPTPYGVLGEQREGYFCAIPIRER